MIHWDMSNVQVVVALLIFAVLLQVTTTDSCKDVDEEMKVSRIQLIKWSILDKLGMQQPPNLSGDPLVQDRIHKYIYGLREPDTSGVDTNSSEPVLPKQEQEQQIPYLGMHPLQENQQPRTRRNVTSGMECDETLKCCRYPLVVDFEEFGWNWIIEPKRYYSNYCGGTCDPTITLKNVHTSQENMTKSDTIPRCTARKKSAISIMYYDQDFKIQNSILPNMVVDSCGCS